MHVLLREYVTTNLKINNSSAFKREGRNQTRRYTCVDLALQCFPRHRNPELGHGFIPQIFFSLVWTIKVFWINCLHSTIVLHASPNTRHKCKSSCIHSRKQMDLKERTCLWAATSALVFGAQDSRWSIASRPCRTLELSKEHCKYFSKVSWLFRSSIISRVPEIAVLIRKFLIDPSVMKSSLPKEVCQKPEPSD